MSLPDRIKTVRLLLRRMRPDDAEGMYLGWACDPKVTQYLTWKAHSDRSQTAEFVDLMLNPEKVDSQPIWLIENENGELCGSIGIKIQHWAVETGYVLAARYHGRGYMTEAVAALGDTVLAEPTYFRFWASCYVENIASARVLEKAGLQREGLARRYIVLPNISREPVDCYIYSRVRE